MFMGKRGPPANHYFKQLNSNYAHHFPGLIRLRKDFMLHDGRHNLCHKWVMLCRTVLNPLLSMSGCWFRARSDLACWEHQGVAQGELCASKGSILLV
eukprot:1156896-Pelagomonas_calceolata.AAC.23